MKLIIILLVSILISSCSSTSLYKKMSASVEKSYDDREVVSYSNYVTIDKDNIHDYMFVVNKGEILPFDVIVNTEVVEFEEALPFKMKKNLYLVAPKKWCHTESPDYFLSNFERCLAYVSFDKKNWMPLFNVNVILGVKNNGWGSSFNKDDGFRLNATFTSISSTTNNSSE